MSVTGEVLIEVDGVSKRFCRDLKRSMWYGVKDIASDCLNRPRNADVLRTDEFWALKDISFQLRRGECLGLIGANGAGKTTLLRIINGLIKPDHGEVRIRGRIGALIALGAGFNPVLTGRENIFVNAAVLGLSKKETQVKLDEIIAFADIGPAIDAPVQSYSSGMTVRLGFAIAAHLEPDILLIDEVLAVGDVGFRTKCYNRIYALRAEAAVIFVSHSMSQVGRLCDQALVLRCGEISSYGETSKAIADYNLHFLEKTNRHWQVVQDLTIRSVTINGLRDEQIIPLMGSEEIVITVEAYFPKRVKQIEVSLSVHQQSLDLIAHINSRELGQPLDVDGEQSVTVRVSDLKLGSGIRPLTIAFREWESDELIFWASACWDLHVSNRIHIPSPVYSTGQFIVN